MSSYQDVNWGYNTDAPVTENPLPLSALNTHLARLGYQMRPRDHLSPEQLIHWEKKDGIPITLAAPQFRADGYYDELVYDLYDIRDMLAHLNRDGISAGHELVAKRRTTGGA